MLDEFQPTTTMNPKILTGGVRCETGWLRDWMPGLDFEVLHLYVGELFPSQLRFDVHGGLYLMFYVRKVVTANFATITNKFRCNWWAVEEWFPFVSTKVISFTPMEVETSSNVFEWYKIFKNKLFKMAAIFGILNSDIIIMIFMLSYNYLDFTTFMIILNYQNCNNKYWFLTNIISCYYVLLILYEQILLGLSIWIRVKSVIYFAPIFIN